MQTITTISLLSIVRRAAVSSAAIVLFTVPGMALSADAPAAKSTKTTAAAAAPLAFPTPEAAFQALADAANAPDHAKRFAELLGASGTRVVLSGDPARDKRAREGFSAAYAKKHAVVMSGDAKATLVVGDDYPLPIPAVKGARGWTLDATLGADEIFARRIGENELDAIQVVRAIIDAQLDYASEDRDGDKHLEYAQRFRSQPGRKDGLYWATKPGEPQSPLGPLAAQASAEGVKVGAPFHGYNYRLLFAQGKDAKGGARNYMVRGNLIGGVAVIAYPAEYGNTGIMTFMANQDGIVFEKDLGPDTAKAAAALKEFNPGSGWVKVGDSGMPVTASAAPVVKDSATAADAVTIKAKIEGIDLANRVVTLRGPMGRVVSYKVDDRVKNLAQVKVGDELTLRYLEAVSVALEKTTAGRSETVTTSAPVTAPAGAKPGAAAAQQTVIVASVEQVDAARSVVLLQGPNGGYAEVKVKDPAVMKNVKVGDKVKVTYTEAVVVDVATPAK